MGSILEKFDSAVLNVAGKFFERPVANTVCLTAGILAVRMAGNALDRRDADLLNLDMAEARQEQAALRNSEQLMEASHDR